MNASQIDPAIPARAAYQVTLTGEIDLERREELRTVVMAFRRSSAADAAVDLSAVTFMDSTGIGALLRMHRTADARHGTVTLVSPCDIVRRILELTHVDGLFKIQDAWLPATRPAGSSRRRPERRDGGRSAPG
jgi:anti-sigma B factor antagonist